MLKYNLKTWKSLKKVNFQFSALLLKSIFLSLCSLCNLILSVSLLLLTASSAQRNKNCLQRKFVTKGTYIVREWKLLQIEQKVFSSNWQSLLYERPIVVLHGLFMVLFSLSMVFIAKHYIHFLPLFIYNCIIMFDFLQKIVEKLLLYFENKTEKVQFKTAR